MSDKKSQNKQQLSEDIQSESNHGTPKTKSPLQIYTEQKFDQIVSKGKNLSDFTLQELQDYSTGLSIFKTDVKGHHQQVRKQIKRKENDQDEQEPTIAQKANNWFAAIRTIVLSVIFTIFGGIYVISKVQSIETQWLKWSLTIAMIGTGIIISLFLYKQIWPRRDIRYLLKKYPKAKSQTK